MCQLHVILKHFSCFHYNVLNLQNLYMIFKNKPQVILICFFVVFFFGSIMMTNVYIIRKCQRAVCLVFKKQNIKCLIFPSCKRLNALLNVCDNEKNQSTRTYVLFLQGKLKELKKTHGHLAQQKFLYDTNKKSHVYRIIKKSILI